MPNFDDVAEKRTDTQNSDKQVAQHRESIEAVFNSGTHVAKSTQNLAKTHDINSLIREVKTLSGKYDVAANKVVEPPVVNINLDDKLELLTESIAGEIQKLDSSEQDSATLQELKSLNELLSSLQTGAISDRQVFVKTLQDITNATKSIDVKPVVKMPTVKVEAAKLDLKPLQKTLTDYLHAKQDYVASVVKEEGVELSNYRAQDIIDEKDRQYIGFLDPTGNWYIIENDVKNNSLRYVFGNNGYSSAFSSASTYEYLLLDEAIHALQA